MGSIRLTSGFSALPDERRKVRRKPLEKLEQIMRSAEPVFAERGYHAARIHEICARADVSVGTFYSHFEDKRELMIRVIEDLARRSIPPMASWNLGDVPEMTRHLDDLLGDGVTARVWRAWREAVLQDSSLQPVEDRIHHFAVEQITTAVTRARAPKGVAGPAFEAAVVAWAVLGIFREYVSNQTVAPPRETTARLVRGLALLSAASRRV